MTYTSHPTGGRWTCGECGLADMPGGHCCPECHTVLCPACAATGLHHVPHGPRFGRPCGDAPALTTLEVAAA